MTALGGSGWPGLTSVPPSKTKAPRLSGAGRNQIFNEWQKHLIPFVHNSVAVDLNCV